MPGHGRGAAVRPDQGGQDPDQRGLAGSIGPEQGEHARGGHIEIDPPQHLDVAVRLA
jgi:hypothetical protein